MDTNHYEAAQSAIQRASSALRRYPDEASVIAQVAQAHATLALADAIRALSPERV